jgi:hypothetical protein
MSGASIETTLELWAWCLRDVIRTIRSVGYTLEVHQIDEQKYMQT